MYICKSVKSCKVSNMENGYSKGKINGDNNYCRIMNLNKVYQYDYNDESDADMYCNGVINMDRDEKQTISFCFYFIFKCFL